MPLCQEAQSVFYKISFSTFMCSEYQLFICQGWKTYMVCVTQHFGKRFEKSNPIFILKSILSQLFVHNCIAFCQRPGQA